MEPLADIGKEADGRVAQGVRESLRVSYKVGIFVLIVIIIDVVVFSW